ncbi:efflux RND transporter periplasmic adaptor subunit, partial [bacterium AH-315-K03]|nr:efflux RND transporter periplasmic adaptor subunit [bacterium AH-315-K03]
MPPLSKSVIPLSSLSWIYVFCILLPLSACDSAISENHSSEAVESVLEVDVINMQPQSVTIKAQLAGRTVPYLISEVRPQVNGIIKERQFQEGNTVKAGEILYQIDPVIYQATFDSAKAELEKSEANLITTQLKAQRFKNLASSKAISLQDYDDATAAYKQARATVAVDKASLQTAQINLDYTHVSSPISGRIGRS